MKVVSRDHRTASHSQLENPSCGNVFEIRTMQCNSEVKKLQKEMDLAFSLVFFKSNTGQFYICMRKVGNLRFAINLEKKQF